MESAVRFIALVALVLGSTAAVWVGEQSVSYEGMFGSSTWTWKVELFLQEEPARLLMRVL